MLGDISYHKATLQSEGKHSIHFTSLHFTSLHFSDSFGYLFCFLSADDNDVMFTEEIIRPVLSAMKVSYNLLIVTLCSQTRCNTGSIGVKSGI